MWLARHGLWFRWDVVLLELNALKKINKRPGSFLFEGQTNTPLVFHIQTDCKVESYSCALICVSGNLSLFIYLQALLGSMRALFFRATATHLFDLGVSISDQHSTLPIRVASLFALGIYLAFLSVTGKATLNFSLSKLCGGSCSR